MNVVKRLETLRSKQGWTWEELAAKLELSNVMIYYVRKGQRDLGVKAQHRLSHLETAAGIQPPPATYPEHQPQGMVVNVVPPNKVVAKLRRQVQNIHEQIKQINDTLGEL